MRPRAEEISSILKEQIQSIDHAAPAAETGTVLSVGDGIARIHGLSLARIGERLEITGRGGETHAGLVLTLERDTVGAAVFGDAFAVEEGDIVTCTGRLMDVPVGEALLGRVVNALGIPIDDKGPIQTTLRGRVEGNAPGRAQRLPVREQLLTGIKIIDACVPLGRGQRQLLLGDRKTGKTAVAVDTIINQRGQGVFCVYVAIGQRLSTVRQIVDRLEAHGAMAHTTVVVAAANEAAPARCLAPLTGMAMGEHYRDSGRHALCVFDDLSSHAVSYREMALLLGHLPGADGHAVDIISVHSRLLERAAKRANRDDRGSSGSLTALAVVETEAGDVSRGLPAHLIDITDGQIAFDSALFDAGRRPAVDVGASFSHVGRQAQGRVLERLARWKSMGDYLHDHLTRHRAMAGLATFGFDLDAWTRARIDHGARVVEIMKQGQSAPLPVEKQVLILFAITHRLLEDIPVAELPRFEERLHEFVESMHGSVLADLLSREKLDEDLKSRMRAAIEAFKKTPWNEAARVE